MKPKTEIPMKEWRVQKAAELGVSPTVVAARLSKGQMPYPTVRRVNKRVVFVQLNQPTPTFDEKGKPLPNITPEQIREIQTLSRETAAAANHINATWEGRPLKR